MHSKYVIQELTYGSLIIFCIKRQDGKLQDGSQCSFMNLTPQQLQSNNHISETTQLREIQSQLQDKKIKLTVLSIQKSK